MKVTNIRTGKLWSLASFLLMTVPLSIAQNTASKVMAADMPQALGAPYEQLQWQTMFPEMGRDSPQLSILRVDPKTGTTQLMIRTPKNMHTPLHWHSANETHTVIFGTAIFGHEGKLMHLGPGGFNYMPAKMQHEAWTSDGAVLFITVDGAWDVNWVGNPPSKSDLGQKPPISPK